MYSRAILVFAALKLGNASAPKSRCVYVRVVAGLMRPKQRSIRRAQDCLLLI